MTDKTPPNGETQLFGPEFEDAIGTVGRALEESLSRADLVGAIGVLAESLDNLADAIRGHGKEPQWE